ncbi:MAG: DUF1254 domain-containing protein [Lachnospiraceae bacterium]|nr:DUF1254 domain-containing protein [Lachnospiraceae bacterium]
MKTRIFSMLLIIVMIFATVGMAGYGSSADSTTDSATETASAADGEDSAAAGDSDTAADTDAETDETWELVRDAYVYTFPLVLEYATMEKMTNTVTATSVQAPVNQFIHAASLATADSTDVVTPNVDTVYSQVWLDLSEDAVVIEKPAADRYCSIEVMDAYTNCVAILGTGGDTSDACTYLFTGPDYNGEIPDGMTQVSMPTNMGWIIVRTLCEGTEDLENVAAIQSELNAYTLTLYQEGGEPAEGTYDEDKNYTPLNYVLSLSPAEYFTLANDLMNENPPAAEDANAIASFAEINVGPGLTFDAGLLGSDSSENWTSMLTSLTAELSEEAAGFIVQNGIWSFYGYPIAEFGTEYAYRALIALGGFGANPVSMAMYLKGNMDEDGNQLSGGHSYVLHFEADALPPVEEDGFWSVTVYDSETDALIDNAIDRYCINDRSELQYNEDGSLDIYLQAEEPEEDQLSNWLPVSEGTFHLMLRIYLPAEEASDGTWSAPTITMVE